MSDIPGEVDFSEAEKDHHQQFFRAVGMAITSWQYVEIGLFMIFARFMKSQNGMACSAAYHAVINFQTRLAMVDAMAQVMLENHKPLLRQWALVLDHASKRAARRNEIVHFMLMSSLNGELKLEPTFLDTRPKKKRQHTLKQIMEIMHSFRHLNDEMEAFCDNLGRVIKPPLLGKSRAQASHQN